MERTLQISYTDSMTPEEYNEIRVLVGYRALTPGQAERGLAHTTFLEAARDNGKLIGMGRILYDYGSTAYIADIFVHPDYQRKGIGSQIVKRLMSRTLDAAEAGERIFFILGAAKGKEPFYEQLGFLRRPNEMSGCGMSVYIEKSAE